MEWIIVYRGQSASTHGYLNTTAPAVIIFYFYVFFSPVMLIWGFDSLWKRSERGGRQHRNSFVKRWCHRFWFVPANISFTSHALAHESSNNLQNFVVKRQDDVRHTGSWLADFPFASVFATKRKSKIYDKNWRNWVEYALSIVNCVSFRHIYANAKNAMDFSDSFEILHICSRFVRRESEWQKKHSLANQITLKNVTFEYLCAAAAACLCISA